MGGSYRPFFCLFFGALVFSVGTVFCVGAGLLAMVVNDDAVCLNQRSALATFASKLAPTGLRVIADLSSGAGLCRSWLASDGR